MMMSHTGKIVRIASRVKTPLALAGVVIIVLYAIYRQILSMDVFANIGGDPTFTLLQNIVDKIFWLALIALVLGIVSYLITLILKYWAPSHSSNVILIDASLNPHESPLYEESEEDGVKTIRPKEQISDEENS